MSARNQTAISLGDSLFWSLCLSHQCYQCRRTRVLMRFYRNIRSNNLQNEDFANSCDPLFFTSSVFVKSPERVAAIALIMGLCLLVYSIGQRQLRYSLVEAKEMINNQLRKPTQYPTLRWVFLCFQDVHLLQVTGVKQIANLTEERRWILRFLGAACGQYYLLCWNIGAGTGIENSRLWQWKGRNVGSNVVWREWFWFATKSRREDDHTGLASLSLDRWHL